MNALPISELRWYFDFRRLRAHHHADSCHFTSTDAYEAGIFAHLHLQTRIVSRASAGDDEYLQRACRGGAERTLRVPTATYSLLFETSTSLSSAQDGSFRIHDRRPARSWLRIQGSATNVLNHPAFDQPALNISDPGSVGKITASYTTSDFAGPREVMLGLRFEF
jgi:hypothetical protein